MPSKPAPRTAAIRRWVALCAVMLFLSVWLAVLTLGKGGLATSNASAPATTTTTSTDTDPAQTQSDDSLQNDDSLQSDDDQGSLPQDQSSGDTSQNDAPSLSTSQS